MWDYDKLFAVGNVVGVKNMRVDFLFNKVINDKDEWNDYCNNILSLRQTYKNPALSDFEIQYIIRLDEHGNVIEKLFDRERDMEKPMPKLETGMFVRVPGEDFGYVDTENNRIIYQNGGYDDIDGCFGVRSDILEVYAKETCSFNGCKTDEPIWQCPKY